MYPSGSAPARKYGTPKMHKFSSSDAVLNSFIYRYFESSFTCSTWWLLLRRSFFFASQIKNANLSSKFLVSCDVTSLFTNISFHETIDIAINLIFNHNPNVNITKKNLKNFSFLLHHRLIFFLTVNFIMKLMEQPWVVSWLLSLLIF